MKTAEKIDTGCGAETSRRILNFLMAIVAIAGADALSFSGAGAGTIGYYRFESGPAGNPTGTTIVDSSGNNNGTVFAGMPQYNTNVPVTEIPQTGQADTLSLDIALTDAVGFNYPFPFQTQSNATVELWINGATFANANNFINFSGDQGFNLTYANYLFCIDYVDPNGTIHELGCSAPPNTFPGQAPGAVDYGEWVYVAYVKQGNVYWIYLNYSGTNNVTTLFSKVTDISPNLPTNTGWTINGLGSFQGLMDEVRLSDTALTADQFLVTPGTLSVTINIKPTAQAPVPLNLKAPTLPVAILSSPTFDATTQVDPSTITLAGASVTKTGGGKFACGAQDVNGDGLPDLVCQVITSQLQLSSTSTMATLTGETFTGQQFTGGEAIKIVVH